MLVIDFYYHAVCVEFVPKWKGTSTGHQFNDIFHVHIKQGRTDRRTLVNCILKVVSLTSTAEVQSIVHALQKIHLVIGKYIFFPPGSGRGGGD